MKIAISFIVLFFVIVSANGQLPSICTSDADAAVKKYKTFVMVDKTTGYVLAKTPVKYNPEDDMPTCYFTMDPKPENYRSATNELRKFVVHTLQQTDEQWVLENNLSEKDFFFGRLAYINNPVLRHWEFHPSGDYVIIRSSISGHGNVFLAVDAQGDLKPVNEKAKAAQWKLYYVY